MNKSELRPGDILLLKDEPTNTTWKHKMISIGQAITSLNVARDNKGSSDFVHAVIWVRAKENVAEAEIAEASGSGIVRATDAGRGFYYVYRCKDANLADWAAQVAQMWAVGGHIKYGKAAAIQSVLHSDSFGDNGARRAKLYAKDAFSNNPAWGVGGAFCSHFVIACYQGAAEHVQSPLTGFLATDAQHCSVRAMQDRLIRDAANFPKVGNVRIDGTGH